MSARGIGLALAGAAGVAALLWKRSSDVQDLIEQLDAALEPHLAQWAPQLGRAAAATAPDDVDSLRWGLFLAAIMDRESRGGLALSPRGPKGTGDYGHGLGLMQLDDRAHPGLLEHPEQWGDPEWNVATGAGELAALYGRIADRDDLEPDAKLLRVAAAYNRGPSALTAANPNWKTTGGNYGTDVVARLNRFAAAAA